MALRGAAAVTLDLPRVVARARPGATLLRDWRLHGGVSAEVIGLELALPSGETERLALRRHGAAKWKLLAPDVTAREFALLQALHREGLPVPAPITLDTTGEILATPYFVMELVDGTSDTSGLDRDATLSQMASFLARLHALDPASLGLPKMERREDAGIGALDLLPPGDRWDPLRERIFTTRLTAVPDALLHGDFWPGNLLWRDGSLVAVVDWEDSALGPAASDLACCRAELNALLDEAAVETFTARYLAASGPRRLADLALWDLYVGAAALASLHQWGLDPEVERQRRERTTAFVDRAARELLG